MHIVSLRYDTNCAEYCPNEGQPHFNAPRCQKAFQPGGIYRDLYCVLRVLSEMFYIICLLNFLAQMEISFRVNSSAYPGLRREEDIWIASLFLPNVDQCKASNMTPSICVKSLKLMQTYSKTPCLVRINLLNNDHWNPVLVAWYFHKSRCLPRVYLYCWQASVYCS